MGDVAMLMDTISPPGTKIYILYGQIWILGRKFGGGWCLYVERRKRIKIRERKFNWFILVPCNAMSY
jgi:hypothetical protein